MNTIILKLPQKEITTISRGDSSCSPICSTQDERIGAGVSLRPGARVLGNAPERPYPVLPVDLLAFLVGSA